MPDLADFLPVGGRHVGTRHPGRSLAGAAVPGGSGACARSSRRACCSTCSTTGLAAAVLVRLGRSPLWAALVLFHPTLALYSRTIMADEAAGAGLLLAAWPSTFPGAGAAVGAGLAVGLAATMRYHAGARLAARRRRRSRSTRPGPVPDATPCSASWPAGWSGGLIVAYNLVAFQAPAGPVTGSGATSRPRS